MPFSSRKLASLLLAASASIGAHAFNFTFTPPAECAPMQITWSGGTGPFRLDIIHPGNPMQTINIPKEASGTFTTRPLYYRQAVQLLFTMSDSTGYGTGGVSRLVGVEPRPPGAAQCDTTGPQADFVFFADGEPKQCKPYAIGADTEAILPITVYGFQPGGAVFTIPGGLTSRSADWEKANFPVGTQVVFCVRDAQAKNGGCSAPKVIQASDDDSCLSTAKKNNVAAIAGGVVGGLAALGIIAALVWFFRRKKQQKSGPKEIKFDLNYDPTLNGPASPPHDHLLPNAFTNTPSQYAASSTQYGHVPTTAVPSPHATSFYASQTSPHGVQPYGYNPNQPHAHTLSQSGTTSSQSGSQFYTTNGDSSQYPPSLNAHIGKGAQQQQQQPLARPVVVHQDISETMHMQAPEELPPQYSDSRAPIPGLPTSDVDASSSSGNSAQAQARALRDRKG